MKLAKLTCCTLMLITCLTFSQCKKKDELQLPPETTIGAMSFGCKINGEIFLPQDGRGRSGLRVEYVNLGTGPGEGWYLNIPALNWKPNSIPFVSITTDSLLVSEGLTYNFKNAKGNAKAFYSINGNVFSKLDNDEGRRTVKNYQI